MPHTLILRLPANAQDDAEWVGLDAGGTPDTTRQRGPLALASAVGRAASVVVLVPATHILLAEPELPPGSGPKLARAVPFALEEQLTEDVDQLVFALGRRRPAGSTPVAVVARRDLTGWLAQLAAAGLEPTAIHADISLLPSNPGQTVLWLEGRRLSVRRPGQAPFSVDVTPLTDGLIVAGLIADPLADPAQPHVPESVLLYATREDWARVQGEVERLADAFASLKIQLLTDGPLPWLARGLAGTDAVNLLQGEFARTTDYGDGWRRWRTAAALAGVLLAVHVGAEGLQLRQAKHEAAALDAEIAQVFSTAMPGEAMRDPRRQMQTQLERIRRSGPGQQVLLRSLQSLAGALSGVPKVSIESLNYHEETLDLKVSSPSLAELSQVSQYLGKQGFAAEIQSSTPAGTGVDAHLQVRSAAAKARR